MMWFLGALAAVASGLIDRPADVIPADRQTAYKAWLTAEAIKWEAEFARVAPCPQARVSDIETEIVPLTSPPPDMAERGLKEGVRVEGCGRSTRQNILVFPKKDGSGWVSGPGYPGVTLTYNAIQTNVMKIAGPMLARLAPPGCAVSGDKLVVGELSIAMPPGSIRFDKPREGEPPGGARFYIALPAPNTSGVVAERAWQEKWPMTICGKAIDMGVLFLPMKDGTLQFLVQFPTYTRP